MRLVSVEPYCLIDDLRINRMQRHTVVQLFRMTWCIFLMTCLVGCSTKYTINAPDYKGYAGEVNQHARFVHADKKQIFELLTNEETFQTFCPEGTRVAFEPPRVYRPGTFVTTNVEHIFKLGWTSHVEEVVPYHRIRLSFRDGFFAGGTELWELETVDDRTRVTQTIIVEPKGFIRRIFWNLKVRLKHNIMVEAFLDKLKDRSESL